MRLEFGAVVSVSRSLGFTVAMLFVVSTVASFGDTRHHEQAGRSTVISGSAPVYASDGGIGGRIAVYAIDPDRGIERVFTRNGSARGLSHLGVFRSGDANYLLAEQRNKEHWKSAFELAGSRDTGFTPCWPGGGQDPGVQA